MLAEFVEVLVLMVRGALFAGLCWGAWLCLAEQLPAARSWKKPLERFATFAVLVLLLTALGGLSQA